MSVLCAWCRKLISEDGGDADEPAPVSHGICADCRDNLWFQEGVSLEQFIESLRFPVVLLGSDLRATFSNSKACAVLGKTSGQMSAESFGDVFECEHARLPEGCGRTVHCSGCTIRRTLIHVRNTGESQLRIPCTLEQTDSTTTLEISALKSGQVICLRIDRFEPDSGE